MFFTRVNMRCAALLQRGVLLTVCCLAACTTNDTGPVVIRDAGGSEASTGRPTDPSKVQPVAPVRSTSSAEVSPLKSRLMAQSEKKLKDNDPKSAIRLAERGLRVDRKEPTFYQVLASAYHQLNNQSQSVYFAKQGLRYAKKGSDVYALLKKLSRL